MSAVKSFVRTAKNITKGYTEVQIKVRDVTSNDPVSPQLNTMSAIAEATFNNTEFLEAFYILDKRLNDHGKNWRHVYKALILLEYLLLNGSESCIEFSKENIHVIKTLKEFQYVDDEGRDQGANVRQKCKEVVTLLADEEKLRSERSKIGNSSSAARPGNIPVIRQDNSNYYNEDSELERALEESKRSAATEEGKRKALKDSEEDLQKALVISQMEDDSRKKKESDKDQIDFFAPIDTYVPPINPIQNPYNTGLYQNEFNPYGQPQPFTIQNQPTDYFNSTNQYNPTGSNALNQYGSMSNQITGFNTLPNQNSAYNPQINQITGFNNPQYSMSTQPTGFNMHFNNPNPLPTYQTDLFNESQSSNNNPFGSNTVASTGASLNFADQDSSQFYDYKPTNAVIDPFANTSIKKNPVSNPFSNESSPQKSSRAPIEDLLSGPTSFINNTTLTKNSSFNNSQLNLNEVKPNPFSSTANSYQTNSLYNQSTGFSGTSGNPFPNSNPSFNGQSSSNFVGQSIINPQLTNQNSYVTTQANPFTNQQTTKQSSQQSFF